MHSFTFFFFNDTATTEIYTLSLHDALPIYHRLAPERLELGDAVREFDDVVVAVAREVGIVREQRSEEHTSELQSRPHLVCRLLLEKKKKTSLGNSCVPGCLLTRGSRWVWYS